MATKISIAVTIKEGFNNSDFGVRCLTLIQIEVFIQIRSNHKTLANS